MASHGLSSLSSMRMSHRTGSEMCSCAAFPSVYFSTSEASSVLLEISIDTVKEKCHDNSTYSPSRPLECSLYVQDGYSRMRKWVGGERLCFQRLPRWSYTVQSGNFPGSAACGLIILVAGWYSCLMMIIIDSDSPLLAGVS